MKILRKDLQDALNQIKPAIATKDPLTQLLCVWFNGKRMFAYNNTIGIDVKIASDFTGGVMGTPLVGLVNSSVAEFADLAVTGNTLALKMKKSVTKLPSLDFDQSVWNFPKLPKQAIEIDGAFLTALSRVLLAANEEVGVSFINKDGKLLICATDNGAMAWHYVDCPDFPDMRLDVSPLFCEQLISLCGDGGKLYIAKDAVMAVATGEDGEDGARLFSRLSGGTPLNYDKIFELSVPANYYKRSCKIPGHLAQAYDRALILAGEGFAFVQHVVAAEQLTLNLKSPIGTLRELVDMVGVTYELDIALDVSLLRKAFGATDRFLLNERSAMLLWGKKGGYIVQTVTA